LRVARAWEAKARSLRFHSEVGSGGRRPWSSCSTLQFSGNDLHDFTRMNSTLIERAIDAEAAGFVSIAIQVLRRSQVSKDLPSQVLKNCFGRVVKSRPLQVI